MHTEHGKKSFLPLVYHIICSVCERVSSRRPLPTVSFLTSDRRGKIVQSPLANNASHIIRAKRHRDKSAGCFIDYQGYSCIVTFEPHSTWNLVTLAHHQSPLLALASLKIIFLGVLVPTDGHIWLIQLMNFLFTCYNEWLSTSAMRCCRFSYVKSHCISLWGDEGALGPLWTALHIQVANKLNLSSMKVGMGCTFHLICRECGRIINQ